MVRHARALVLGLSLALAACGTHKLTGEDGTETQADDEAEADAGAEVEGEVDEGESDEADAEEDGGGLDFVPDEDIQNGTDCDVFEQDCAEGEKCVPTTWSQFYGVSRCVPVLGEQGVDEPCEYHGHELGSDDCDANSHCWNLEQTEEGGYVGSCVPICQGTGWEDATCEGQGESCFGYECRLIGQVGMPLCVESCDPMAQDCGEGMSCVYYGGYVDTVCAVQTLETPKLTGETCESASDCAPGLMCGNADYLPSCEGWSCCTPFCAAGDDASCDAAVPGTVCSDRFRTLAPEGCPEFGGCFLPGEP